MKTLKRLYMALTVFFILVATYFLSRPLQTTETMLCAILFTLCALGFVVLFSIECNKLENQKSNQNKRSYEHRIKKG